MAMRMAFTFGVEIAGVDRLMMIHKISFIMLLPESYYARGSRRCPASRSPRIRPGSAASTRIPSNFFAQIAVEPDDVHEGVPGVQVSPEQMKAWLDDRQGAHRRRGPAEALRLEDRRAHPDQGDDLAAEGRRPDLGVQHRRHLRRRATRWTRRSSSSATTTSTRTGSGAQGLVGWYIIKIADPSQAAEMAAGSTTSSPTRRPKPRRRRKSSSCRASRSRSATSARS